MADKNMQGDEPIRVDFDSEESIQLDFADNGEAGGSEEPQDAKDAVGGSTSEEDSLLTDKTDRIDDFKVEDYKVPESEFAPDGAQDSGREQQAEAESQASSEAPADAQQSGAQQPEVADEQPSVPAVPDVDAATLAEMESASKLLHGIVDNVETVIYGKRQVVELVLLAIIARGHVLIEDVPGVGKTSLVSALAKSISCNFNRIQFTPDVMPSDVTGFSIFNQKTREFQFRSGGVMSNIVLADEINRASAKTQSALLEAMEERQVTVDNNTYKLEEPFMVLATQNPIEQFGTFPLPEAQIDRFLVKTSIGYPAFDQEVRILDEGRASKQAIGPVATQQDIIDASNAADKVYVSPQVQRYIVEIVTATRNSPEIQIGASPRGSIALADLCRAFALYQGRSYVIPDDVKILAHFVLCHRFSLSHSASVEGRTPEDVLNSIISGIAVPVTSEDARQDAKKNRRNRKAERK